MKFIIPGTPVAKGRPRLGRGGVTYTPSKTKNYENLVKLAYQSQVKGKPIDEAVSIKVNLYFPIPKSYTKKKKAEIVKGALKFTKRPDLDNCLKSICDALNGLAYKDDSQIYKATITKDYDENPRAEVEIMRAE